MFCQKNIKKACYGLLFLLLTLPALSFAQASRVFPAIWLLVDDENVTRFEQVLDAYTDPNSTHIFIAAHRGGRENDKQDRAPGNSIANITNARNNRFDLYESDIEIVLGDGAETLIVFHDDVFDFLTNTTKTDDKLDDADLAYTKSLELTYLDGSESGLTIATLEEFLTAAKDQIMVKFDLKSGVFTIERLVSLFNIIQQTGTQKQVLIRGGEFLLTTARDNGFDTQMIMRRYGAEPSIADVNALADNYNVKAISIPNGASAGLIQAAKAKGLIVEVHESQNVSDQQREIDWQAALDSGVRQFHSFKPTKLKRYLESNGYREF